MSKVDFIEKRDKNIEELEAKYELLTPYKTVLDSITTRCKTCGTVSTKTARSFLRGCNTCKNEGYDSYVDRNAVELEDNYVKRISRYEGEYVVFSYRGDTGEPLKVLHTECGGVYELDSLSRFTCKVCYPEKMLGSEWFPEVYKRMKSDGYELKDIYYGEYSPARSRSTYFLIKHKICGTEYTRTMSTFKKPGGYECPECVEGKMYYNILESDPGAVTPSNGRLVGIFDLDGVRNLVEVLEGRSVSQAVIDGDLDRERFKRLDSELEEIERVKNVEKENNK